MGLKIALVGFSGFPEVEKALSEAATRAAVEIVGRQAADVFIIPHHLDKFFPDKKPWVAIWIGGCGGGSARFMDWREMSNPPQELFRHDNLQHLIDDRAEFFGILQARLANPISWK